jgi:geranylgeranyl diphosphate synthase type II
MDIRRYMEEKKRLVESHLADSIEAADMPESLRESMLYSLNAGGKRIRPVLVFAGAEAVGGRAEDAMPAAICIEMIHTFSLIHDDLPAMDDDDLRRGKPTNHKVFGEAGAILAGDALLAEAFYVMASAGCDAKVVLGVLKDIASATGGRGMTGGQVIDIQSTSKRISEEALIRLHRNKTGSLLMAAATSGAKMCDAKTDEVEALASYGSDIGLAFQIVDDILDIEGDQTLLGKDIGSDVSNEKSTFPAIIGLAESKKRAASLIDRAISTVSRFGERALPLQGIAKFIVERKA